MATRRRISKRKPTAGIGTQRQRRRRLRRGASNIEVLNYCVPRDLDHVRFNHYIKKIMRKVNPGTGINKRTMRMVDDLVKSTLHRIALQASMKLGRKKTLKPNLLLRGAKKVMPRALVDRVNEHAQRALATFQKGSKRR